MPDPALQRLRLTYSKGEAIRFISNLDLIRLWERAARRAGLPLAYSQGFNPQPKIANAHALPVGCAGSNEVMDLWLTERLSPEEVARRLRAALPPAVRLTHVEEVDPRLPSLQSLVREAEYRARVWTDESANALDARVQALLAAASLPRRRRRHDQIVEYDLRPLVMDLRLEGREGRWLTLWMRLRAEPSATGRPDEVLEALGLADCPCRLVRERLLFA
jgi:radical SAM-linked protein